MNLLLRCLVLALCLAAPAHADDTDIYGTVTTSTVEPNVLIVFDTSGSMATADVPGNPYDSGVAYPGQYDRDKVYYKKKKNWDVFTSSVGNITCSSIKTNLETKGHSENSKVKGSSPFSCDSSKSTRFEPGTIATTCSKTIPTATAAASMSPRTC